jgi:hypothetical protein
MKTKLIALTGVILVLALVLAGCASGSTTTTNGAASPTASPTLTARQILDNSVAALKGADTFQVDTSASVDLNIEGGSQPGEATLQMTGSSSVDSAARQLEASSSLTAALPGQSQQTLSFEVFVLNGWAYAGYTLPLVGEKWSKMQLNDQTWSQLGQNYFSALLASAVNVNLEGSETIEGVDYYVLVLTPDFKALSTWLQSQFGQNNPAIGGLDFSQIFQQVALKSWIDKKTFLPLKQTLNLVASVTSQQLAGLDKTGLPFDSLNLNFSGSLNYKDFGKPVVIDVPQQALDAPEATPPSWPK